jgi:DNA-binding FrmR family transcriptional regulator
MNEDKKITVPLKKAGSHLKNVIRMVEEKKYCMDILQQNMAVIGLLKSANDKLLERHLKSCFATAMKGTDEKRKQQMIGEVLKINGASKY